MSQFLFLPFGSSGDTYPSVGLARELHRRGHDVTVCVNAYFKIAVERAGLRYLEFGAAEEYMAMLNNPDLWDPHKGFKSVVGNPRMPEAIRRQYLLIEEHYRRDEKVTIVAGSLALGARIAEEKLGARVVGLHLQPLMFFSATNPPVAPNGKIPAWLPPSALRLLYWFGDKYMFSPVVASVVEPLRRELGLPRRSRYIEWMHSEKLELGLFPKWYGHARDWPKQLRQTGFPLFDDRAEEPLAPEVEEFLSKNGAPIVCTFGTGMVLGEKLFAAAADACYRLNRRGILLTPFRDQLPKKLPQNVAHFNYVPLTRLLPRAAAIIHHGGIGTTSQALRAGIPQVITPLSHDQPDNADRVEKLGVGRAIPRKKVNQETLSMTLDGLLEDPRVTTACKDVARRFENCDTLRETCEILESFAQTGEAPSGGRD
ncbi:MAG TPA: nucleotide disphospho-sugar-binding domain-containing protein [Planctomycetota bacterium]|nr:nucleotide disphospho-sugar-binding domain-containing protein [Planctomycetota bacterium]